MKAELKTNSMNNIFKQSENFTKIYFDTYHSDLSILNDSVPEEVVAITMNELESQTVESAESDIWRVEIFIDELLKIDDILDTISQLTEKRDLRIIGKIKHEQFSNYQWEENYEKNLAPVIIDNFHISSNEKSINIPDGLIPICIKSSRAFGTGDHETTSGCIRLMNYLAFNQIETILDIGTGSGILSFVAKKLWPSALVSACDIDPQSLEVAKSNSLYNNTDIKFFQNSETCLLSSGDFLPKYDLIIANILQNPLIAMAESITSITHNRSKIILSGFLSNQTNNIEKEYRKHHWIVEHQLSNNGWDSILLKVKTS